MIEKKGLRGEERDPDDGDDEEQVNESLPGKENQDRIRQRKQCETRRKYYSLSCMSVSPSGLQERKSNSNRRRILMC